MYLLGLSLLVLILKVLEVSPVAGWSWWYVCIPFIITVLWFELGEPLFGFDKKRLIEEDSEKTRQARMRSLYERQIRPHRSKK